MEITVTITLDDQKYVLGPRVHSYPEGISYDGVKPTIVITLQDNDPSPAVICQKLKSWQHIDDVYSRYFLSDTVILQGAKSNSIHPPTGASMLRLCGKELGVDWTSLRIIYLATAPPKDIPDGPYFIHGQGIFEAWRVYADDYDAFQTTIMPSLTGPHELVQPPNVPHNFRLSGITTALESQSFLNTYGMETETAAFISRLIQLGCIIVGKTKMAAFASAENPPENWVDFRCPRNPRGDQYQQPTGSSTGAGAAMAAYEWLDFSIGTDTTGSIRAPTAFCGLFGIRLSTEIAASFAGVYPNSPYFDTVGLLGRDLSSLSHAARACLNKDIKRFPELPRSILYPTDFFPASTPGQGALILGFVEILENFLRIKATKVNIADLWLQDPPREAEGKSLVKLRPYSISTITTAITEYDDFRADHEQKFGTPPYISPFMKWKWELGKAVSQSDKAQSLKERAVFRSWFKTHILREDPRTGSTSIMILPIAMTKPWYRDVPGGTPGISEPLTAMYVTTLMGMSQLVLPVAQTKYMSKVTKRTEYLPFTVSIAGAPGSDLMLLDVATAALNKAAWPTKVRTGSCTHLQCW
ncbi:amidase signature domain-containing protein [Xylogone sp. PMI_703]|nr:amidase signature domain-containing protein [Xylogone sp. PMI_703]